jgi:AcrR family transcriptional regulator
MQPRQDSGQAANGSDRAKDRTRRLLLESASTLLGQGQMASVAEVAQHAGVSRATAYRYFATRGKMISAVVDFSLGSVRQAASSFADGRERIDELFRQTFPRLTAYEPQLRAALQVSLSDMALERAGKLDEEPYRRGHRIDILTHAAMPLKPRLGKRGFDRLVRALSVVYGIEAHVVLRDIWGARDKEIQAIARWVAHALVDTALRDAMHRKKQTRRNGNDLLAANGQLTRPLSSFRPRLSRSPHERSKRTRSGTI